MFPWNRRYTNGPLYLKRSARGALEQGSKPSRPAALCATFSGDFMIQLTRLNHIPLIVNADLIEHVEVTPDTVVALTTGQKFMVLESAEEVVDKVIQFRKAIMSAAHCPLKIHESSERTDAQGEPASSSVK